MKKGLLLQRFLVVSILLFGMCLTTVAETVIVDGIFYQLNDNWTYSYYDADGNWVNSDNYPHAAIVTYDPSINPWSVSVVDTYQSDLVIPQKVTYKGVDYTVASVGYSAFKSNKSLTSVQLPSSVKRIESDAFNDCSSLISITMPGVVVIDGGVFNGSGLKTITIPKTLKKFEKSMFGSMSELTSINVDKSHGTYCSEDGVMYNKAMTDIVGFPAKKDGNYKIPSTVTTISAGSFPENVYIDELIIPATVTKIESNAFGNNPHIKKLTIEDASKELTIGSGSNSYYDFYDEKGNRRDIYPMFYETLQELYWGRPLSYTSAYNAPFACSTLSKVVFGKKVTSVPKYTFFRCYNINAVDVKGGFDQWIKFGFSEPYSSPFSSIGAEVLPSVTFNGAPLSGAVVIPDGITNIPWYALQYGCSAVTSLTIPAGVETIDDGAFKGLDHLNTINLASENTNFVLEDNVLYAKKKAKILLFPQLREGEYTMPSTITEVGDYQFYNCKNLTGITLSSNLKTIGSYAFSGCSQIKSISIPATVETIKNNAFDGCAALTDLVFEDGENQLTLARNGSYVFVNENDESSETRSCGIFRYSPIERLYLGRNLIIPDYTDSYWDEEGKKIFNGDKLSTVEIGSKVRSMPASMFYNCFKVTKVDFGGTIADWCNITFPDEYATPFGAASENCPILCLQGSPLHSQVNIPKTATKIGSYAFWGMAGVSTIVVPATVKTIEPYAFQNGKISDVYINATKIITLTDANSFSANTNIYIGDDVVSDYRTAPIWSDLTNQILPKGFLQVSVDLVAMTSSPALLPALNALESVNDEYRVSALTNLKIKGTMNGWDIMVIRNKMTNLRTLDLSEATILDNDGGYEYYTGYHTVPHTISPFSFSDMTSLRKVILPKDIVSIGSNAFGGCSNLTEIPLAKGLETIEDGAFQSCSSLRTIVFPTTLKRIGGSAFNSCSSLTDIDFAEGLSRIGGWAFAYCYNLRELHFPTSLKSIEDYAFYSCNNLSEVHVPSMMQSIGDYAFRGCGLKSVYAYTLVPIQINQNTFDYKGVNLYAPDNSFYNYYLNTQWSQFQDVIEFPALYTNWYTARDVDVEIDVEKPIKNVDDENPADGEMEPGSGLVFVGDGEQLVKNLILNWNHGDNYPSLIENGNLSVDELAFIMNVYPGRWYFFSFPFDVKLNNIKHDGKWVWRYYDAEERAKNGEGGWKDVETDILEANKGYIFQCNVEGDLEIPVGNPDFFTKSSARTRGVTYSADKSVDLLTHEAKKPEDASWNFIGNPNLSYYSLGNMADEKDFSAPVTVWDPEQQTYTAVVPGDDDYDFHPFQAFFVQKPAGSEEMTFRGEHRATYSQTTKKSSTRSKARSVDENRLFVNLEISNGSTIDKTRVVFDDSKTALYDNGVDANKFLSIEKVPQIYSLDGQNVKYSVNNRPNGSHEVSLGFVAPAAGEYTIAASLTDCKMALKDLETGLTHDLSKGAYTFETSEGTFDKRFVLVAGLRTDISDRSIDGLEINADANGISISGNDNSQPVNIYSLNGVLKATLANSGSISLPKGTYIVSAGDKSAKVLVK